jgi:hypothetical protein
MPKRIVVSLRQDAEAGIDAVSERLSKVGDMRVGVVFPRQGAFVGEVLGDIEIGRIRAMPEIAGVRVMASFAQPRGIRSGRRAADA